MKKLYERVVYQVSKKERESQKFIDFLDKMMVDGHKVVYDFGDRIAIEKEAPNNTWDTRELGHRYN